MASQVTHGADVERLREVSTQLRQCAHDIVRVEQAGVAQLATLRSSWRGDDLDRFATTWDASRGQLLRAGDHLSRLAEFLLQQAGEQLDASSGQGLRPGAPAVPEGPGDGESAAPDGADPDNNDERDPGLFKGRRESPEFYDNHEDPGPGNVALPKGANPDDPAIRDMLSTPNGRAALDWMARNGIEIKYDDNYDGAKYSPDSNTMTLGKDGYRDAQTIIHEANHARWDAEDRQADVDNTTRDEYINSKYDEETDCVTNEVYYAKQARANGVQVDYTVGEQKYDQSYSTAYSAAIGAGKSPQEAHEAGDAAGRSAIRELFSSGYYKASGSGGKTYGQLKGEYWDAQNDWNPFNGI